MNPKSTGTILDFANIPAMGDPKAPPFREGVAATHDRGVSYRAPWEREGDGFAEHSRRSAAALATTGLPVHLRGFLGTSHQRFVTPLIENLLTTSIARSSVELYQLILQGSTLHNIVGHAGASQFSIYLSEEELRAINAFRVVYSVFERDRVSVDTVRALNRVGQVWTGCQRSSDMLVRCGVEADKVFTVPCPYFDNDPLLELAKEKLSTARKPGPVRFYHIGKWEPRKAQDKILLAFMRAFKPNEANLFMKTSKLTSRVPDYPLSFEAALHVALADVEAKKNGWTVENVNKSIQHTTDFLTAEKLIKVHKFGDVYITLSRGEGFDMPAFDAKLAGNLMVWTPSGGPADFCGPHDVKVEERGSIPCSPFYRWEPEARYLDFNMDEAVLSLQAAHHRVMNGVKDDNDYRFEVLAKRFGATAVGRNMRAHLQQLVEKHGGRLT